MKTPMGIKIDVFKLDLNQRLVLAATKVKVLQDLQILGELAGDWDPKIRMAVVNNPWTPGIFLLRMSTNDPDPAVKKAAAHYFRLIRNPEIANQ